MKRKNVIILLIIIAILASIMTLILIPSPYYDVKEIAMGIEVAEKLGLNTEAEYINFGANFPGNRNRRFIHLEVEEESEVFVTMRGEMATWVELSENHFFVSPGETYEVILDAYVPLDAELGFYTGNVIVYFKDA